MNFRDLSFKSCLIAASLLLSVPSSAAVIQVFQDHNAFLATTGSTSATGPLPNLGKVANAGVGKLQGSVTFTAVAPSIDLWFGQGGGVDWTPLIPGNEMALGERENLDARFSAAVYAAGFDFAEPTCQSGCSASTFGIALRDGSNNLVGSFSFAPKQDVEQFFGVWSDTPFTLMQIRETLPPDTSNEYFGQFYSSSTPYTNSPVPEPSVVAMLCAAALGMAAVARRKRFTHA